MKFHFANCKTLHRNLQCGHCACIFTDWHTFIMHVNAKGMSLAQPHSEAFFWKNIANWQNLQLNNNSDLLNVAMQHANLTILPTQSVQVSDPTFPSVQDITLPILSATEPTIATTVVPQTLDTQPVTSYVSIFTQTTPTHHLPFANDMDAYIPISLWQANATYLQSLKEHVNALLQLNLLLAQLLLYRMLPDRFLSAHEQFVLQTSVAQNLWPHTFLSCSTVCELLNAILVWLYEQL